MRKLFFLLILFVLMKPAVYGQEPNVTLLGRWGKGECEAVFRRGGYTFIGNGAYLELYRNQFDPQQQRIRYVKLDSLLMPGPVKDIWVASDITHIYVACGTKGLQVVYLDQINDDLALIIGESETDGYTNGVMQYQNYAYVADGTNGLVVVDVSFPSNPQAIGNLSLTGIARDVWVMNNSTLLVAADFAGIFSVNIDNPATPVIIDSLDFETEFPWIDGLPPPKVYNVMTQDTIAYVSAGWGGMHTVSVANPANLRKLGKWTDTLPVDVRDAWIVGNLAYLAVGEKGVNGPIDVSNPSDPSIAPFSLDTKGYASTIFIEQDTAYIGDGFNGHLLVNVGGQSQFTIQDSVETADITHHAAISGGYVFAAVGNSGVKVLNASVTNPPDYFLHEVESYDTRGEARKIVKSGSWLYIADGSWGLTILDALNPTALAFKDEFVTSGDTCYDVDVSPTHAFLACGDNGMRIVNVSYTIFEVPGSPFNTHLLGRARAIKVVDDKVYLATSTGIYVYSISQLPVGITLLDALTTGNFDPKGIQVVDNTVFLANGQYGFLLWDTSTGIVNRVDTGDIYTDIEVETKTLFLSDSKMGLRIFDFSLPGVFSEVGYYSTGGNALGLNLWGNYIYLADGEDGLYLFQSEIRPKIELSSTNLNFGPVPPDQKRPIIVWVTNPGTTLLEVTNIVSNKVEYKFSETSFQVAPGDTHRLVVSFEPIIQTPVGVPYPASASIQSNADTLNLSLQGEVRALAVEMPYIRDVFTTALWHLDESAGNTVFDASLNNLNGVLSGDPTRIISKTNFGRAINFDGADDRIVISASPILDFQDAPFTTELWFSILQKPTTFYILLRGGSDQAKQYELALGASEGVIGSVWEDTPGGAIQRTLMTGSMAELNLNQWYHVAFTWDGDSLRLYLNSALRDGASLRGRLRPATGFLNIGSNAGLNAPFRGAIDEVRISRVARQEWEFHVNQSKLAVGEEIIDFGEVLRGYSRRVPFVISNGGGQTLIVSDLTTTNISVEVTHSSGFSLGVNQDTTVWLTYSPVSEDSLGEGSSLVIGSSDPTYPIREIPLLGHGVLSPQAGVYQADPFTLALYHFDESPGDPAVNDASGNGMNGSWTGVNRPSGKFDTELTFDRSLLFSEGQNDICTINPGPEHFIGPNKGGFSVEGWIYMEKFPAVEGNIIKRATDSISQFEISVDSSGIVKGILYSDQMAPVSLSSVTAGGVQFHQWYHVAMTLAGDTLRLYLNGDEVDFKIFQVRMAGHSRGTLVDSLAILIGRDLEGNRPFSGRIDEVRISGIRRQAWEFNVIGARVAVSTDSMDFGTVLKEEERSLKLWVKNPGIDSLNVTDVFTSIPLIFDVDVTNFSILPGDSHLVQVTYSPPTITAHAAQLILETNDPFWPLRPVYLMGKGTGTRSTGPYDTDLFTLALYHFDEGSDTTLYDSSGVQLDGELWGSVAWSDSGRFDGSLWFEGTDGWIEIPYHYTLDFAHSDFTLELWFSIYQKPADYSILLRRGSDFVKQFELGLSANDGILGSVWDSQGEQHTVMTGSIDSLNTNQWYHVAFSWDGDFLRLMVNNELWDSQAFQGSLRAVGMVPLSIGGSSSFQYPFHGFIDEMRVSNTLRKTWEMSVLPPTIFVTLMQIDFALVLVDSSRTFSFQVVNAGDQDLVVSSITGAGGVFSIPGSLNSFAVPGLKSQTVPVTYSPVIPDRTDLGTLTITSGDTTNSPVIVTLEGSSTAWRGVEPLPMDAHTSLLYHFGRNDVLGDTMGDTMVLDISPISPNGLNGYLRNGARWTADGFFNGGLHFDGVNDRVQIPFDHELSFDMTSEDFTVECYFRTDTVSQALIFLGYEDSTNAINYGFSINTEGRIEVEGFGTGGSRYNDNSWHHMVFTYDHASQIGRLYVDGVRIWSKPWTNTSWNPVDRPLILGAAESEIGGPIHHFQGYMDEVRISKIIRQPWEFQILNYGINESLNPNPPVIEQPLTMNIQVPAGLNATAVYVSHRIGGSETYQHLASTFVGQSTYQVIIPASNVTLQGLEYYIQVFTPNDTLIYPGLDPQNNPETSVIRHSGMDASVELEYRRFKMFSIPFDLDSTEVASVLEDDFGPWDPYKWRLFWWHRLDSVYIDYTDTTENFFDFVPGRAYWIITDLSGVFDIGSGQTVSTDSSYHIPINPGWNMVGLPYYFSVAFDDCYLSSDSIGTLYFYDEIEGYRLDWPIMDPWKGYWIYNADPDHLGTISVNPRQTVLGKKREVRKGVLHDLRKDEWSFRISVETASAKDLDNFAGARWDAKAGWDFRDRPEPPPIGNYIMSYFDHTDRKDHPGKYAADIRCPGKPGYVWEFIVESHSSHKDVTVQWMLYQNCPAGWEAYLFDLDDGTSKDMFKNKSLKYVAEDETPHIRRFRLVAGSKAFIENNSDGIPLEPVQFYLFQNYPNPFNPETTIRYSLPKKDAVEIVIFNAIGQRVRVLLRETKKAGHHEVVWDGRDDYGRLVSSGVYLCRLQATERMTTRKMVILK